MTAPRIVDRPLKVRLLALLPMAGAVVAGVVLVPWFMTLAGVPAEFAVASAPVMGGFLGALFALETRPAGAWHLILLAIIGLAMVVAGHLAWAFVYYLIAPDGEATGGLMAGLIVLRAIACIAAAAGIWFLIARLTRHESLWDKSAEITLEGAAQ